MFDLDDEEEEDEEDGDDDRQSEDDDFTDSDEEWKEDEKKRSKKKRNLRQWIVRQTKNMKTSLVTFAQQIKFWNLSFNNNDEVMVTFSLISKIMKI